MRLSRGSAVRPTADGVPAPRPSKAPAPAVAGSAVASPVPDGLDHLLAAARVMLGMELTFLAHFDDARMAMTAVDRDEPATGDGPARVRLAAGEHFEIEGSYCARLVRGQIPAAIPDAAADPVVSQLPITEQLGIGAYCGVPVRLPDGQLYGTLCGLHPDAMPNLSADQLAALQGIAELIGHRLALQAQDQQRRNSDAGALLALAQRGHIALQPIVDLASQRALGFEALSRFTDSDGAALPPQAVFTQAQVLGCTVAVEQAVAATALDLLDQLPGPVYLSLNLSPSAILDAGTVDLLWTTDLSRLVVEVTEHEQVADYLQLNRTLAPLRADGLRLAVDDTGAGFAGLQHMARLAPDIIKLDTAFVRHADTDATCRAIARAVAGYATEVGAVVVAEGIETFAEAETLEQLGATLGQGFFFGSPRPAAEAISLIPRQGR